MNAKRKAVKIGRRIRKETGIPFPDAMRLGKIFARGKEYNRGISHPNGYGKAGVESNVTQYFSYQSYGCDCCGGYDVIKGPDGYMEFSEVRA